MNILARIQLAIATITSKQYGIISTMKEISEYSERIITGGYFSKPAYRELQAISQASLSRAINNKATKEKEREVLEFLEALLDEYFGLEFSESTESYISTSQPEKRLPILKKEGKKIDLGISIFPNLPYKEVRQSFRKAKDIQILQTFLPKWSSLGSAITNAENIRILLIEPYSDMAHQRGLDLEHNEEGTPFNDLIIGSVRMIIRTVHTEGLGDIVKLRFYRSAPAISMYSAIDHEGNPKRFIGIFWHHKTTIASPIIQVTGHRERIANSTDDHFESLWEQAGEDVPLDGKAFNSHLAQLRRKAEKKRWSPNELLIPQEVDKQGYYFENGKQKGMKLLVDLANDRVSIQFPEGKTALGLVRKNGVNWSIIAESQQGINRDQHFISLFLGNLPFDHADQLKGLYTRTLPSSGIPISTPIIFVSAALKTQTTPDDLSTDQVNFLNSLNIDPSAFLK